MGPLFSLALVAALGVFVTMTCFVCAVVFLPVRRAAVVAVVATTGGGIGVVVAAVAAIPFAGIGQTLSSGTAVVAYLLALGCGGLLGGVSAALGYLRHARECEQHAF